MSLLNEILNKNKSTAKKITERVNYDLENHINFNVENIKNNEGDGTQDYVIKDDNTKNIPSTIQKDNKTKELTLAEELAKIKKECPWHFLKDEANSYKNNDRFLHKLYVMKKHDRETYNQMIKGE